MDVDIAGLPDKLVRELSLKTPRALGSPTQDRILKAVRTLGHASFNQILVQVYQDDGTILTRATVQSTVNLLATRGQLDRVNYGVYSLPKKKTAAPASPPPPKAAGKPKGRPAGAKNTTTGCDQCGGEFKSKLPFSGGTFCSPQCIKDYRAAAAGGTCAHCGGVLPRYPFEYLRKKFCKESCVKGFKAR